MIAKLSVLNLLLLACIPVSYGQANVTKPVLQAAPAQVPASAAPALPAASVPPGDAASSSSYIIGPGDTLEVTVFKEPGLSNPNIPVRPDGMISLSLLGDLPASGLTPMRLSTDVAARLQKYINDPRVTVTVLGIHPKEIYMLGEVGHVGPIPITPDMTPLQAIAAAGGLSPYAKAKHIYILRNVAGAQKKIPFDYKKAIKDGNLQGVTLVAGDTVVVP